jgi:hypothetical protein
MFNKTISSKRKYGRKLAAIFMAGMIMLTGCGNTGDKKKDKPIPNENPEIQSTEIQWTDDDHAEEQPSEKQHPDEEYEENNMCTINDGEGKLKEIYCSFVYGFGPYICFMPFIFLLSHVITDNERFFVDFGRLFMLAWIGVLVFIAVKEINDYSVGETVKIILLTLFTILIVCLLAFIIYVLWSQVIDFAQQIPREVVYKIES